MSIKFRSPFVSTLLFTAIAVLMGLSMFAFPPAMQTAKMQEFTPTPSDDANSSFGAMNVTTQFYNLSFSNDPNGPAMTYFPPGTQQVFARWAFDNVPAGTRLVRDWYINGQLFIHRDEAWNPGWGTSNSNFNAISIYDFQNGLSSGYYHMEAYIEPRQGYPAAQIIGDFTIADYPSTVVPPGPQAAFSDLTMSTSAAGAPTINFPAGTQLVSVRWNYANIPVGSVMRREWYLNGVLFNVREETWSSYWGNSGRLTHISLYDYQFGLNQGSYKLVIYLRDNPSVRVQTDFTVGNGGIVPPGPGKISFSNLSFSTMPDGLPTYTFPRGTLQIFARWDYSSVPAEATVIRRWYRNGVLWLERAEWFPAGSGHINNVSIYDYRYGLPAGVYYVQLEVPGTPAATSGTFEIQ